MMGEAYAGSPVWISGAFGILISLAASSWWSRRGVTLLINATRDDQSRGSPFKFFLTRLYSLSFLPPSPPRLLASLSCILSHSWPMFSREVSICKPPTSAKVDRPRCRWVSHFRKRDATRLVDTSQSRRKENVQFDKVHCLSLHHDVFVYSGNRSRRG